MLIIRKFMDFSFFNFFVLGAPPSTPSPRCKEGELGLQSGDIPDDAITASSQWDGNHGPIRARLNSARSGAKTGAWSAKYNDLGQWIQVCVVYLPMLDSLLSVNCSLE